MAYNPYKKKGPKRYTQAELIEKMTEAGELQAKQEAARVPEANKERHIMSFDVTRYTEGPFRGMCNLYMTTYDKNNKKIKRERILEGTTYEMCVAKIDLAGYATIYK